MPKVPGLLRLPAVKKMRPPSITCSAVPLLTALRSDRNRDARYSRCRRYPIADLTSAGHKRVIVRASRFTPVSQPRHMNGPKLERLCRYIARPAVSNQRLSLTRNGQVRYQLKTPYTDGTTHVLFEPLDFMSRMDGMPRAQGCAGAVISRLVALIPRPRVNLMRFHGVFAPNSKHRGLITPAQRGKGKKGKAPTETQKNPPLERHIAMTWPLPAHPSAIAPGMALPPASLQSCASRHRDILTNGPGV